MTVGRNASLRFAELSAPFDEGGQSPGKEAMTVQYISDLSRCTPAAALSLGPRQGRWQVIRYETVDDAHVPAGTMIGAASYVAAPEVVLPLQVTGWHAIYIGYWNPHHDYDGGTTIKIRLTGERCFTRISEPAPSFAPFDPPQQPGEDGRLKCYSVLREVFVKHADLTGRDLVLGKVNGPFGEKAYIAYIKLVPLSQGEVAALQAARSRPGARSLVATNDGISYFWGREYRTLEHLLELVEPFRYSEVGRVLWAVNYGETTNYPSRVGTLWGTDPATPIRQSTNNYVKGEKVAAESLHRLLDRSIVPQQAVAPYLREMGVKFDIMFRLGISSFENLPPRHRADGPHGFLASHPEYRMAMADGTRVEKASYAYPQVRAFMLALIEEAVRKFDPDGVNLCFLRGPEYVLYEPPVLDEFQAEYGEDAIKVALSDPRMKAVRSSFMTRFVRDVRSLLDRVGKERGRRIELSALLGIGRNLDHGLDAFAWINEGWPDSIMSYGDDALSAAAEKRNCSMPEFLWDVDVDNPARFSQEARERQQDVTIRLRSVGGIDISHTDASRSSLWEGAYSGG